MAITARNTTTPDSTFITITVDGAASYDAARDAARHELDASRYTVGARIVSVTRLSGLKDVYSVTAEYA